MFYSLLFSLALDVEEIDIPYLQFDDIYDVNDVQFLSVEVYNGYYKWYIKNNSDLCLTELTFKSYNFVGKIRSEIRPNQTYSQADFFVNGDPLYLVALDYKFTKC
jgi:hypothetical protein